MTTYVYNEHDENQVLTMRNKLKKKKRKRRIQILNQQPKNMKKLFLILLKHFMKSRKKYSKKPLTPIIA